MNGRASRVKGATAEREVVALLNAAGFDVNRTPHSGALEWLKGDVTGFPGVWLRARRYVEGRKEHPNA